MFRAYKYRLYPTKDQEVLINKHINACRFVYNLALETKNHAYASHRKRLSCFDLIKQLPDLKKECEWLKDVDASTLQQAIIDLEKGFTRFFKGQNDFPKFKKKSSGDKYRNPAGSKIQIKGNKIYIPKFREGIFIIQERQITGNIKTATVSKTPTGKYFISLMVDTGEDNLTPKKITESTTVGIDLGLADFIVTSEGVKVSNPKRLQLAMDKMKHLSRQVSKKRLGGANRKKAQHKLNLLHEKLANQRKDFLHKLSTDLVKNHDTICCEKLNVEGLMANRSVSQAISNAGWSEFVRQLKYKSEWYGKNLLQIPTFEPSTKLCSVCGTTKLDLTIKDRHWTCTCGAAHDRDINAAINIKNYCLKNNGGEEHRQKSVELPTMVGALKQEKPIEI